MSQGWRMVQLGPLCLGLLAVAGAPAHAQGLPSDVLEVLRHRVGTWEVQYDVLAPDGSVARVTSERHEAGFVINGEIVEIHGFIEGREDYRAFLLFNPSLGRYVYTTIDRSNNHVVSTAGRHTPYRFTSSPFATPDGGSVIFRLVFESVKQDRMEGYGEASTDGGASWRRVYNQRRTRIR